MALKGATDGKPFLDFFPFDAVGFLLDFPAHCLQSTSIMIGNKFSGVQDQTT